MQGDANISSPQSTQATSMASEHHDQCILILSTAAACFQVASPHRTATQCSQPAVDQLQNETLWACVNLQGGKARHLNNHTIHERTEHWTRNALVMRVREIFRAEFSGHQHLALHRKGSRHGFCIVRGICSSLPDFMSRLWYPDRDIAGQ